MPTPPKPNPVAAPSAPAARPELPPAATRQRIAQRMAQLLLRELGSGIEVKRMLAQPLYARDVLLVCDAMRGSDLAMLAEQFRAATEAEAAAETEAASQPASLWPDSSGGSSSLWPKTWFRNSRNSKPK